MMKKYYLLLILLVTAFQVSAQKSMSIIGKVIDHTKEGLPGVNVVIKGTSKGTITDMDGNYSIAVESPSSVLVFSYLGYETQDIKVGNQKVINVTLNEESKALNEVVVVGYQEVRRKDLTGSVAKANLDDMLKAPVATFDQALGGRVAGVMVTSGEGAPGGQMNIVIRGNNSLTQENSPLYVLDGFPVEDPAIAASINPNDIESIDILKDASATAIYGARGANGVVIITTKKGKVGEPVISYSGSVGVQRLTKKIKMMDAYEFVRLQSEIFSADEMDTKYFATVDGKKWTLDDYRNVDQFDWQDAIFRDAFQQNHSLSLTGGTNAVRYNSSFSYFDQDGIVDHSNFNRLQGRLGTTITKNKLRINLNANYSRTKQTGSSPSQSSYSGMNNLFYSVWGYRPVTYPGVPLSSLVDNILDENVETLNDYRFNPILSLQNEYRQNVSDILQLNGYLEYTLAKGLKLKVSGGYTLDMRSSENFNNSNTRYGNITSSDKVNASFSKAQKITWLNENTLTYQTNIKKKHFFNLLGGITFQASDLRAYSARTINIPNEGLGMAGMGAGTPNRITSDLPEWTMMSYLARVNYNYKSKYYATASFRADGSSKFIDENRFGYFPSASLAWNFTEEDFVAPVTDVLNSGKLRASWGTTGNNRIGEYDTYAILKVLQGGSGNYSRPEDYTHGLYPFNDNIGFVGPIPYSIRNPKLKWETTTQYNVGMDLGFFKDRIGLTLDWYNKITSDLLLRATIPASTGFNSVMKNIGKVENKGVEITLNTVNIETKDFSWSTNFNIAFNKNKVLELADNQLSMLSTAHFDQQYTSPNYIAKIGFPMGMMYGYMYEGTYKYDDFDKVGNNYILKPGVPFYSSEANTQPGFPKYRDLNEDGVIDAKDQTMIGNGAPLHIGGFTNNLRYKNIDLSIFFQWSYGNDILNANKLMFETGAQKKKELNQFASFADRWSPENPNSDIPSLNQSPSNKEYSSRLVEDGSFLRLKNITLGYNFNAKLVRKAKIQSARVYVTAENLFTWTKYSGYDPEVSIRNSALTPGMDFSSYPRAMSFNFGVNLSF